MRRKTFLRKILNGIILTATPSFLSSKNAIPVDPRPLDPIRVKQFVIAGHGDLDKVKEMLAETPNLLYAKYDWGQGDFEAAIEGAAHIGDQNIVNYLMEKGARVNLFTLTMLGKTDLVKPVLEAYPKLLEAKGAHGFTLLHHAQVGGISARPLLAYLEEKGLKETKIPIKKEE